MDYIYCLDGTYKGYIQNFRAETFRQAVTQKYEKEIGEKQ